MAKLLFGGLMGIAGFFFLRSAALIKIFYPKLAVESITNQDITSSSVIIISFLGGLLGPSIVRNVQNQAARSDVKDVKCSVPPAEPLPPSTSSK